MSAERGLPAPGGNADREKIRRQHQKERGRFRAEFRAALAEVAPQASDLERRAVCLLVAGIEHEKASEYETAAERYRLGLSCEPGDRFCAYFLHNNYGYCLNVMGRPAEAEWYCRTMRHLPMTLYRGAGD